MRYIELLECVCTDFSHLVKLIWWNEEPTELYFEFHLNNFPLLKRIPIALNYILGRGSKYGMYEEVCLDETGITQLRQICGKLLSGEKESLN